jgi:ribosomal protein L7/L12
MQEMLFALPRMNYSHWMRFAGTKREIEMKVNVFVVEKQVLGINPALDRRDILSVVSSIEEANALIKDDRNSTSVLEPNTSVFGRQGQAVYMTEAVQYRAEIYGVEVPDPRAEVQDPFYGKAGYSLWLSGDGGDKITAIKAIRDLFPIYSLRHAKDLVEASRETPRMVAKNLGLPLLLGIFERLSLTKATFYFLNSEDQVVDWRGVKTFNEVGARNSAYDEER